MNTELTPTAQSDARFHLHPYTHLRNLEKDGPLVITRGDGVHVFDEQGNRYLEGMAGLWCASLGFSEKRLAEVAYQQMLKLPYYHSFSGKVPGPVAELVKALNALAPTPALAAGRVIFANSGSESNDTAYKLVKYYFNAIGQPKKKKIIARVKGYHGVTVAAASMSGLGSMHQHFDLPLPDIVRVGAPHAYQFAKDGESETQFVDRLVQELEDTIAREGADTIGAFIGEPVQGAGGVIIPPADYWPKIQAVLKKHQILLIADEVITGFGRLGQRFGSTVFGMQPDMLTVAKQLTSAYVPMSALYVSDTIYQAVADAASGVGAFGHGYTYSGHPLACAMALETLRIYEADNIVGHVQKVAPRLQAGLKQFEGHPIVGHVRGMGLIGAIELAQDPAARKPFEPARGVGAYLVRRAQAHGLITRVLMGDVIAMSPPLIITEAQIDEAIAALGRALDDTYQWVKKGA
jgi:4-aminobutyrate---pyruvate transaminase